MRAAATVLGPDEPDPATEALIAARDGDPRAFERFVRLTRLDVVRFCSYLGDADDVDDLVQDTYLRSLRSLHAYRNDAPALPWLITIARRTCADAVSRRIRSRRPDPVIRPRHVGDDNAVVELHALIAGLDPDQRRAFTLTQLLGLSYDEAADVCACPVGTIRSRVSRARVALTAALVDHRDAG